MGENIRANKSGRVRDKVGRNIGKSAWARGGGGGLQISLGRTKEVYMQGGGGKSWTNFTCGNQEEKVSLQQSVVGGGVGTFSERGVAKSKSSGGWGGM